MFVLNLETGLQGGAAHDVSKPSPSWLAPHVHRNPISRRFFPCSATGANFEVVVCGVSAIEVTLRHQGAAFLAKMFVHHHRSPYACS
jgi:hypothetical protein